MKQVLQKGLRRGSTACGEQELRQDEKIEFLPSTDLNPRGYNEHGGCEK